VGPVQVSTLGPLQVATLSSRSARRRARRGLLIAVVIGDREAEALIGNRQLGAAAVDVVAGEVRGVAEVLPALAAVATSAIGPAQPGMPTRVPRPKRSALSPAAATDPTIWWPGDQRQLRGARAPRRGCAGRCDSAAGRDRDQHLAGALLNDVGHSIKRFSEIEIDWDRLQSVGRVAPFVAQGLHSSRRRGQRGADDPYLFGEGDRGRSLGRCLRQCTGVIRGCAKGNQSGTAGKAPGRVLAGPGPRRVGLTA
jgi:hypothetical protein